MTQFDVIPYVFELAKVQTGWDEKKGKFCMRYDDYTKYLKMFDELCEFKQKELVDRVMMRKKKKNKVGCERG
jgi:hypothetical protein